MAESKTYPTAQQRVIVICPPSDSATEPMFTQAEAYRLVKPLLESNALWCSDEEDMHGHFVFIVTPPTDGWSEQDKAVLDSAVSALSEFGYEVGVGRKLDEAELEDFGFADGDLDVGLDEGWCGARAVGIAALSVLAVCGILAVRFVRRGHRG